MRNEFLRTVSLSALARVTQAQVDQWLWEGVCELARTALPVLLRKSATITLSASTEVYNLPADFFLWQSDAPTIAGYPLLPTTEAEADMREQNWDPLSSGDNSHTYWYEAGQALNGSVRRIGIRPVPSAAGTVKIYYLRLPAKVAGLTSTSTEYSDLPGHFHRAPVYWAALQFAAAPIEGKPADMPVSDWAQIFAGFRDGLAKTTRLELQKNTSNRTPIAGYNVRPEYWPRQAR